MPETSSPSTQPKPSVCIKADNARGFRLYSTRTGRHVGYVVFSANMSDETANSLVGAGIAAVAVPI